MTSKATNIIDSIYKIFILLFLLAGIVTIFSIPSCLRHDASSNTTMVQPIQIIIDTVTDTIIEYKTSYLYIPSDTIIVEYPVYVIDTNKVINTWIKDAYVYEDTLQNDSNLFISLTDTVYQNTIKRGSTIKDYNSTVYVTITNNIYKPIKHSIALGLEYNTYPTIVGEYSYMKDWKFELGANTNKQLTLGVKKTLWNKH